MAKQTWLWWSSGKVSAWSLHTLREDPDVEVTAPETKKARTIVGAGLRSFELRALRGYFLVP